MNQASRCFSIPVYGWFFPEFIDFEELEDDYLNSQKERHLKNTHKRLYNCGGYAFKTFNWYCPFPPNHKDWNTFHSLAQESLEDALIFASRKTLEHFPRIRIIDSISEQKADEFLVAFRVSEIDIHYMRKANNGSWYDKRGNTPNINRHTEDYVLNSKSWYNEYSSRTILFALKE